MNGYAAENYLSVKKNTYSGVKSSKIGRVHSCNVDVPSNRAIAGTQRAGESRAVTATKNEGFVYVEHCGVMGTIRDIRYTKKSSKKTKSCFDKVVIIFMFAVLLFFIAGSYCEYRDMFNEIKAMESQMLEYREEQAKLLMAIEQRDDLAQIEEYAVNNLGMVKSEKLTRHYVNISEKDIVTISDEKDTGAPAQGVLLSGFKNIISNVITKK